MYVLTIYNYKHDTHSCLAAMLFTFHFEQCSYDLYSIKVSSELIYWYM